MTSEHILSVYPTN